MEGVWARMVWVEQKRERGEEKKATERERERERERTREGEFSQGRTMAAEKGQILILLLIASFAPPRASPSSWLPFCHCQGSFSRSHLERDRERVQKNSNAVGALGRKKVNSFAAPLSSSRLSRGGGLPPPFSSTLLSLSLLFSFSPHSPPPTP